MTKSTIIVLNMTTGSIVGTFSNIENAKAASLSPEQIVVQNARNLEILDLGTLTRIFNAVTGENKSKFKISKAQASAKVWAAIENQDISTMLSLDPVQVEKVKKQAKAVKKAETMEVVVDGKVRKVRDSKLQRMAAAFREQDENGQYKVWTVKELMEKCAKGNEVLTEKITNQYISVLRAQNDRFVMNIVKNKETGTFQYQPKSASV